jgi:hypothetical protein
MIPMNQMTTVTGGWQPRGNQTMKAAHKGNHDVFTPLLKTILTTSEHVQFIAGTKLQASSATQMEEPAFPLIN